MSDPKPSAAAAWSRAVLGVVLMVGGMVVSQNTKPMQESLAHMGLPLDPGKSMAVVGVFLILFPVIHIFFIAPLQEAIGNRTRELESTFSEAEDLRSEMASLKSDYEQRITATEADARAQIQAQIREAQELKKQLTADAIATTEDMKRQAAVEIEAQKKQVLGQLRVHVADLSLQASEKIIKENLDNDRNRKLIDDFLATVEVRN